MKKSKDSQQASANDSRTCSSNGCALFDRNPVAKFAHQFNQGRVFKDRKKHWKLGYRKHKGQSDAQAA